MKKDELEKKYRELQKQAAFLEAEVDRLKIKVINIENTHDAKNKALVSLDTQYKETVIKLKDTIVKLAIMMQG